MISVAEPVLRNLKIRSLGRALATIRRGGAAAVDSVTGCVSFLVGCGAGCGFIVRRPGYQVIARPPQVVLSCCLT
ncbi:hypothetical protein GCM10022287_25360 [Gryllotalpicola koreensis]|uniref:Uncharacterized protein n=1 Tax=Gryllotalpicola koreensis TaxID=993086 RepID=A0ABP8A3P8_9MICO